MSTSLHPAGRSDAPLTHATPTLLSDSGLLIHGARRVSLCRSDCAFVRLLLDHYPAAVPLREVTRLLWPEGNPSDVARGRQFQRIRRQLAAVDLALRNRVGIGFTLEPSLTSADRVFE